MNVNMPPRNRTCECGHGRSKHSVYAALSVYPCRECVCNRFVPERTCPDARCNHGKSQHHGTTGKCHNACGCRWVESAA